MALPDESGQPPGIGKRFEILLNEDVKRLQSREARPADETAPAVIVPLGLSRPSVSVSATKQLIFNRNPVSHRRRWEPNK